MSDVAIGSPRVAAVVMNWHGRRQTIECLRSLAAIIHDNLRVILIDNGGSEFTVAEVRGFNAEGVYIPSLVNQGFAAGANLGMREALAGGAQYVWFLNNDAVADPAALSELLAVAGAPPHPAVVGAKILQRQDPQRIDSIALGVDLRTGRLYLTGHDEIDAGQYDGIDGVTAVTGCAMLVSRAACERLRGFDERYFAYLEDADLCLRARAAGFGVTVAPRARVLHDRAPATAQRQSASSLYYTTRNHLRLMREHGTTDAVARLLRPAAIMGLNLAYALRGAPGTRAARLRAVLRGVRDYRRAVTGAGPY
jgi:hypothetical protein